MGGGRELCGGTGLEGPGKQWEELVIVSLGFLRPGLMCCGHEQSSREERGAHEQAACGVRGGRR